MGSLAKQHDGSWFTIYWKCRFQSSSKRGEYDSQVSLRSGLFAFAFVCVSLCSWVCMSAQLRENWWQRRPLVRMFSFTTAVSNTSSPRRQKKMCIFAFWQFHIIDKCIKDTMHLLSLLWLISKLNTLGTPYIHTTRNKPRHHRLAHNMSQSTSKFLTFSFHLITRAAISRSGRWEQVHAEWIIDSTLTE